MTRVAHYVRPNETTRIPRRHIFLDVEAVENRAGIHAEQTWRLAVANFWTREKGRRTHNETVEFDTADSLWKAVGDFTRRRTRTVLWTHNLGYDIRVSSAFTHLPTQGWRLVAYNLSNRGTWATWRRGDASLCFVDSASVFPVALKQIGEYFGLSKPDLPAWEDSREAWLTRCHADVEILSTAVRAYLDWLDSADLGNWQYTGAGQSYAAYRHRFLCDRLLVHDDPEALAAERRAMWTGRCEAYWHGNAKHATVHEWDLHLAYARIAKDCDLPSRLIRYLPHGSGFLPYVSHPKLALLTEVTVDTAVPCVPTQVDGRIIWPTGRFTTTLWSPEIDLLLRSGAAVTFHRGWLYRKSPVLRDWATWIIDQLGADDSETPAWRKVILKHWSRALIGRFAMTYAAWEPFGTMPAPALKKTLLFHQGTDEPQEMMQVGRDTFVKAGTEEWGQSMPSITGYVMSVCRVRLWNIMLACPANAVLYSDTDSIIVTDTHHDAVKRIADSDTGHGLRLKRSWEGISVYGPRQIVTGNNVRISGLPKRASQLGDDQFTGTVWESVETAVQHGRFDTVRITPRKWRMKGIDKRRDPGPGGWTLPRTVHQDEP